MSEQPAVLDQFGNGPINQEPTVPAGPPLNDVDQFGNRSIINPTRPSAQDNIVAASMSGVDADQAAKSIKIGDKLGIPPSVVDLDPERYNADATRKQALDVVEGNKDIANWVEKNPVNAKLALTDADRIRKLMEDGVRPLHSHLSDFSRVKAAMDEGIAAGWGHDPIGLTPKDDKWFRDQGFWGNGNPMGPFNYLAAQAIATTGDLSFRFTKSVAYGGMEGWKGYLRYELGLPRDLVAMFGGEYLPEHLPPMPEAAPTISYVGMRLRGVRGTPRTGDILDPMLRVGGPDTPTFADEPPTINLHRGEYEEVPEPGFKTEAAAEPYVPPVNHSTDISLRYGERPRPGTDWTADQLHMEDWEVMHANFENALKYAQETELRERSPQAMEDLLRGSLGTQAIHIPYEILDYIYRDTLPHPEDGFLGWMENAEHEIAVSLALGTDLSVPMAQALAHMDPAFYSQIKDQVRFSEVGVNAEEAKVLKDREPEQYPVDTVSPKESIDDLQRLAPQLFEDRAPRPIEPTLEPMPFGGIEPSFQKVKVVSGFDVERSLDLFGISRYENAHQMAAITLKELLQNAFDAVKDYKAGGQHYRGKINITMDRNTRTIAVHDNGVGMDLDLMGNKFWQVAGTQKASSDNSGGFGISKMLWQHNNTGLRVYTLKNGVLTSINTNGKAVRASFVKPDEPLVVDTRLATQDDLKMFPNGHGTRVEVDIPKSFERNGEQRQFEFSDWLPQHPGIFRSPLFRDIEVNFNKSPIEIGQNFPIDKFTQFMNAKFSWGDVRIYVTKAEQKVGGVNAHILSNGIWQFSTRVSNNPRQPWELVPREFYFDVKPKVNATDIEYPFDMNRQRFSQSTSEDFDKIIRYMSAKFRAVDLSTSARNFGDISELVDDPAIGGIREVNKRKLEPALPPSQNIVSGISEGDTVEVKDGKLIVRGREIPELTEKDLQDTHINLDELMVSQKEIDPRAVLLHDNIEIDSPAVTKVNNIIQKLRDQEDEVEKKIIALENEGKTVPQALTDEYERVVNGIEQAKRLLQKGGQQPRVSLVDAGRVAFGDRFNEYLHYIGKVFHELRDFVAEELSYPALKDEGIGISFDKEYYGVSIRIPFSGTFINPAIAAERGPRRVGLDMIHTMIHELAHHKVRDHDAAFADEMQRIKVYVEEARLYNSNKYDIGKVARGMIEHMEKNSDIFDWLSQQIKSGAPSTRGKRLKGAESAGGGGGLPPDVGQDQLAGGAPDVEPAKSGGTGGTGTDVDQGLGGDEELFADEGGGVQSEQDELFESPEEYAQRLAEERNDVETDLTLAVKRERRALYLDPLFKDPKSAGMDAVQFGRYSRKIAEADQHAYEKALEKAKNLVKKRLTPEWKRDREQIKDEVTTDLRSHPMILADRLIRLGELPTGELVERRKLDAEAVEAFGGKDLDRYTVKRNGANPDDLAPFLGFANGKALVDSLNKFEQGRAKWDKDKGPAAYTNHLIDRETDERMERRYGSLSENILDEARDLVTTASHMDILTDEMQQLAQMAGLPFKRETIPTHVEEVFNRVTAQNVSYEKFRKGAEKQAKIAEKALLKGGYREAFQAKLEQYSNVLMAKEAKAFEKTRMTTEKNFRKLVRQEKRQGIDQDYYDNARKVLRTLGFADFQSQEPMKDMPTLINESSGQAAVAPWVYDSNVRRPGMRYDNLTTEEFIALRDSVRSILKAGADAKKVNSTHGAADLDNFVSDVERSLSRFPLKPYGKERTLPQRINSVYNIVSAPLVLVERMLDYTDQFDPNGPITRFLDRPLRDSYVKELQLMEQAVGRLRKLEPYARTALDSINNTTILDPRNENRPVIMNRHNLRMVMLHLGSESGVQKLQRDYNVRFKDLWDLVHNNAIKDDVDWVNGMHALFDWIWSEAAPMIRRYTGIEPDRVIARPSSIIKLKPDGSWSNWDMTGGYAPYFHNIERSNIEGDLLMKGSLFDKNYTPAIPAHGYTMPRTGYKGWMDMDGTMLRSKIYQMIHDTAFREAVRNAQKVIAHPGFMMAMRKYWGDPYAHNLYGWLNSIANVHSFDDQFAQGTADVIRALRQATINTLINYNPGTAIKHGLSAGIMSAAQRPTMIGGIVGLTSSAIDLSGQGLVGAANLLLQQKKLMLSPAEREAILFTLKPGSLEFMMQSSALMRNRVQQYPDTLRGAYDRSTQSGFMQGMRDLQALNNQYGRFMVSFGDLMSAGAEWNMTYKDALRRTGDHDDAVFEADRAVARAHGSTFYGDKPAILRLPNTTLGEFAKTSMALYAFFNHMLNNWFQWSWDLQARVNRGADSEPGANYNSLFQRALFFGVALTIAEGLANPPFQSKDDESWGTWFMHSLIRTYGGMIPGVRELTNGLLNQKFGGGWEPSAGMLGAAWKIFSGPIHDIQRLEYNREVKQGWTHAFSLLGMFGVGSAQVGRTVQGAHEQLTGREYPRSLEEYRALYRKGFIRPRR